MNATNLNLYALVLVALLYGCGSGAGSTGATSGSTAGASSGASVAVTCTAPAKTMTFDTAKTGQLYAKGDKVCFDASTTTLIFNGKTIGSPSKNTVVSAPFSAYIFVDGAIKYEVVFNGTALFEINVSDASGFFGQFV
jgi:hypothetical protein